MLLAALSVNCFGAAYSVSTPYDEADLALIQYQQINDVMYLVHPDYAPYKLTRLDHDSWTCAKVDWEWGPFLDQNSTTTTITPDGVTGSIGLEASAEIFVAGHVGSIWEIITKAANTYTEGTLNDDETSDDVDAAASPLTIEGDYLLTLEGTYAGHVKLEKSDDSFVSAETLYVKFLATSAAVNVEYSGNEPDPGWEYRVSMEDYVSGSVDFSLVAYNADVAGYVEITAVTDADTAVATVQEDLASATATAKWSEGAWSTYRGFPRAICMYQNRLCIAGTSYQPNGFWTSRSAGDYENMLDGPDDDDAIVYEVGSAKQNPIVWMQDKNGVIAGTTGNVIRIFSSGSNSVMTPASVSSERQGENSSAPIQAALVDESIIYVDRNQKIIRDIIYSLESDSFVSPELSIFAEHITDPGITEIAVQERPDTIIWSVKSDGKLLGLTYDREQQIVAWHEHITDGNVISVACIPGDDEDELWMIVEREIESTTYRYVEWMHPQDWGDDQTDCWFLDSALEYDSEATATITGLSHLEGESVDVFTGTSYQTKTVASGQITGLSPTVTKAVVGLPYTSQVVTFPVEVATQQGSTVGFKKKIYQIVMASYKSMNCEYGEYGDTLYDVDFTTYPDSTNGTTAPYSGLIRLTYDGGWKDETQVHFKQDKPYPMGLTGLVTKVELSED